MSLVKTTVKLLFDEQNRQARMLEKLVEHIQHLQNRVEKLEKEMRMVNPKIQSVVDDETALEKRVTAHETNAKDTAEALQKQIDDLKVKAGLSDEDVQALSNLATHLETFDPDNPTPPPTPEG